jgi:glycosyltransferase involved in cell wall biosynthesis
VLIDYVVPYGLRKDDGRANGLACKLRHLAEMRAGTYFRLFAPYADQTVDLPENVVLISQKRLRVRILQEVLLNLAYLYHLIKKRPDCLIVRPDALFLGQFLAKLMGVHLVLNIHSYPKEEYGYVYHSLYGSIFARIVHAIFWGSIKCADGIVFNHPRLQDYVANKHAYRRLTASIYNGADTSRFYPLGREAARRAMSLPVKKTILLFLGSVTKWHGVEHLLAIASVLQANSKDILIYVAGGHAGTEEYIRSLRSSAPANVVFTGKVDADQANLYINAADVCLLPVNDIRVSPGSPIKLFDYIAAGRPVVTQAGTTGYSDLVVSHKLGYVVDFRDSLSAATKICEIVDKSSREDFESHNRQVALNTLNWRNVASQWNTFLDKVAQV